MARKRVLLKIDPNQLSLPTLTATRISVPAESIKIHMNGVDVTESICTYKKTTARKPKTKHPLVRTAAPWKF